MSNASFTFRTLSISRLKFTCFLIITAEATVRNLFAANRMKRGHSSEICEKIPSQSPGISNFPELFQTPS